jgi:hypothetical protein
MTVSMPEGHRANEHDSFVPLNTVSGNADTDRDDGLPDVARYEGPDVPTQEPLINPSSGPGTGPIENAATDINPIGPAPVAGTGPYSDRQVYPPDPTVPQNF